MARPLDDGVELDIGVHDTGMGIPAERQAAIFTPFAQADSSTTRTHGGTGLGLSICQRFVEMMGGAIGVDSEPGRGSTYRFTARFGVDTSTPQPGTSARASASAEVSPTATADAVPPMRLLLVEDNPMNRQVVRALLRRDGHDIVEVDNGRLAVERCADETFDAVLMDVQMPVMDGLTAATQIRQDESRDGRPRVPILALTAHAMQGDAERCRVAGMDDYLTKPVRREALRQALARAVVSPGADLPAAGTAAAAGGDGLAAGPTPAFDPEPLASLRDLEEDGGFSIADCVQLFFDDAPLRLENVRRALRARDAAAVHFEAHALKGACREVGALALAETAYALEMAGRAEDLDEADALVQRAAADYENLVPLLAPYAGSPGDG